MKKGPVTHVRHVETASANAVDGVNGGPKSRWKRFAETFANWRTISSRA